MGDDESKMKSMKYKMTVYDAFLKEYEYSKKHYEVKEDIQKSRGTGNGDIEFKEFAVRLLFLCAIVVF